MAKDKKNSQKLPEKQVIPAVSAEDELAKLAAKNQEEKGAPSQVPSSPPDAVAKTYQEHQREWKSKAEQAAEAAEAVKSKVRPPDNEIPGKYKKFYQ